MLHPIVAARPSYLSEPAVVEEEEVEEEGDGEGHGEEEGEERQAVCSTTHPAIMINHQRCNLNLIYGRLGDHPK